MTQQEKKSDDIDINNNKLLKTLNFKKIILCLLNNGFIEKENKA